MNISHGRRLSLSGTGSLVRQKQQQNCENLCKLESGPRYFLTENISQAMGKQSFKFVKGAQLSLKLAVTAP